jgi:hypothetical protein
MGRFGMSPPGRNHELCRPCLTRFGRVAGCNHWQGRDWRAGSVLGRSHACHDDSDQQHNTGIEQDRREAELSDTSKALHGDSVPTSIEKHFPSLYLYTHFSPWQRKHELCAILLSCPAKVLQTRCVALYGIQMAACPIEEAGTVSQTTLISSIALVQSPAHGTNQVASGKCRSRIHIVLRLVHLYPLFFSNICSSSSVLLVATCVQSSRSSSQVKAKHIAEQDLCLIPSSLHTEHPTYRDILI